jgi:calcineurin-like phosphoesterase family protein
MSVLTYKNKDFLLVHDPDDIPYWWRGWTIHGHVHWNPDYPFIDGKKRNINVSCEVIDYTPVSLDWILSHDIDTIRKMDDIGSDPVRW